MSAQAAQKVWKTALPGGSPVAHRGAAIHSPADAVQTIELSGSYPPDRITILPNQDRAGRKGLCPYWDEA
jgi:hypothetical protein